MPDYTVQIDLPDHKRGDRWPGIPVIGPILINGSTPAAPLLRVKMNFVSRGGIFRLDSAVDPTPLQDAPIVIDDFATWEASIPPVQNFLPTAGIWTWDMEFYETGNSSPLTLYKGELLVLADVTT